MAGNIKTNSVQLGDSATATQNFVLQTNVDGTAKLARGNLGATTQDILTVDAAGKVTLAGGIDLVSQAGSDYVEGTWTPTLGGTATYLQQVGHYTKIGRVVTVSFTLQVNLLGTGSTTVITGLPFASLPSRSAGSLAYYGGLAINVFALTPFVTLSSTIQFVANSGAASGTVVDGAAPFGNGAYVTGSITYMIA